MKKSIDEYADIINLKAPEIKNPKISVLDRAARFSPFEALTGFDEIIENTDRFIDINSEMLVK